MKENETCLKTDDALGSKGLLGKHMDLSSDAQHSRKNQACWHMPITPALAVAETGISQKLMGQPVLRSRFSKRSCLKSTVESQLRKTH